ncbi:MAG: cytochrome c biogenesis protein CcdA [Rhodobacteraceae bacterium]|nr:cytochrome c biogenesis protein CcdA [Paracoccaceae bacterium]
MEFLLGYAAGLLTLINPCVLPVLPIVLATALQASKLGPLMLAAGMSLSFVLLGVVVSAAGRSFGITEESIANAGALLMIGFGLILLVPRFSTGFATATGGLSTRADSGLDSIDRSGLKGQLLVGLLLGAVWSPCVGPTLGGAIALASQGENLLRATAIMVTFAMGVSTIILALGYGARAAILKRQATMRKFAEKSRPIMGVVFIVVGAMIFFKFHHVIEGWMLDHLPNWLTDFSVSI